MTSTDTTDKPFMIDKRRVYEAFKAVKSSKGGAGVDGQTIEAFEADLKVTQRSGTYSSLNSNAGCSALTSSDDRLVAEPTVATQQSRPQIARNPIEQRPKAWREMFGCMLVAGNNIDIEYQPCASHRVGMIAMARPPWLLGIVADDRPFLMAVERLHGRIDVEYPRLGEKRRRAIIEMPSQPNRALIFGDRREGAPHGVLVNGGDKLCQIAA